MTTENGFPHTGFLRIKQILGDKKSNIPALIPVSAKTWRDGIESGLYPKPVKISLRINGWRVTDIEKLICDMNNQA